MRQGSEIVVLVALGVLGLGLAGLGTGSCCLEWVVGVSLDLGGAFACSLASGIDLRCATGSVLWASYSEFRTGIGYLWQEAGARWAEGPLEIAGDVLFGPSTNDFLYAHAAAVLHMDSGTIGVFWAALGGAVLGGPRAGFAVRLGGHLAGWEIAATTEFASRVADEDFHGIDIVHGATGLFRHYVTAPVASGRGITGETLSVSGSGYSRIRSVCGSAHLDDRGLDVLAVGLRGIDAGVRGTSGDLSIRYDAHAENLTGVSRVTLWHELVAFEAYLTSPSGGHGGGIGGVRCGAVAVACASGMATLRGLAVLDPWRYAIATEEYGSAVRAIDEAAEQGCEVYAQYRALVSIEIRGKARGDATAVVANSYFTENATGGVRWAMSRVQAVVALGPAIELIGDFTATSDGSAGVGLTLTLRR